MFNPATHKNLLLQILKDIYTNKTIGPILGFKGGTAAYLFYNLERFSTDLDFDLLKPEVADLVLVEIEKILKQYGEIKDKKDKKQGNESPRSKLTRYLVD